MFKGWNDSSISVVKNNKNRNESFFSGKGQKISSNVSPFAGISFVKRSFNKSGLSQLNDNEVGQRVKTDGFSYCEIIRNFTNVFCSGGSCAEDIQTHLGNHVKYIPGNNVPSTDTILRGIKELTFSNTTFTTKQYNHYKFKSKLSNYPK